MTLTFPNNLDCIFHRRTGQFRSLLINTPLQRGVGNRVGVETVLTVSRDWRKPFKRFSPRPARFTALKRVVNEMECEMV